MFPWGVFITLVSFVGSVLTIYEFIRLRQRIGSGPQRLLLIFASVFVVMLIASLLFQNIFAQAGGAGPGVNPTPTTSNPQIGTGTTPTPVPPTPPPSIKPGDVVCQADASHGWNGWTGTPDWKVLNGVLISDGTYNITEGPPTIVAPCSLGGTANYAVEATIQVLKNSYPTCFGIGVRGTSASDGWHGYTGTVYVACNNGNDLLALNADNMNNAYLTSAPFTPGTGYHTYRVEAKDNQLRFLIDGAQLLAVTDNQYTSGEQVGLWSYDAQLNVSSFKVIAL